MRGDKEICLICGKETKSIGGHLRAVHGLSKEEYNLSHRINREITPVPEPKQTQETTPPIPKATPAAYKEKAPEVAHEDQDIAEMLDNQRALEKKRLKLEMVRSMTRDYQTPPEQRSGGIMDRMMGGLMNGVVVPIAQKAMSSNPNEAAILERIQGLEDRLDDILAGLPPEKQAEAKDAFGGIINWAMNNPDQLMPIISKILPSILGGGGLPKA